MAEGLLFGAACCAIYLIMGLGFTRLVSKQKDRDVSAVEMLVWPIGLLVFAALGDIQ